MSKVVRLAVMMILAAITGVATTQAQKLDVAASGTKKVVLSDKVGQNQFLWHSEAPVETIDGTAEGITGTISLDPKNLKSISGTISAKVATMQSGNSMRDDHLRSAVWLDAEKYPTIQFTAKSIKNVKVEGSKMTADVTGDFTMHGVTKPMTIPFTLTYIDESAKTRERAPGDLVMISAKFFVALGDFDVKGKGDLIGNKVGESIEIEANLFGSTGL